MRPNRPRRQTLRRRWLLPAITMVSILSTAALALAAAPASPLPPPTLVGSWQVQGLAIRDSDTSQVAFPENQCAVLITEKTLTLRARGETMIEMSYTTDAKQTPATIDAKSTDGRLLGIFALGGDNLRINLNDEAKGRPRHLGDPGGMILALRRFVGQPLFVINADGTDLHQILAMPEFTATGSPDWSHDGSRIAIDAWRSVYGEGYVSAHVFVINADGSSPKDLGPGAMPSWSPDDKQFTYCQYAPENGVWIMNVDGSGRQRLDPDGWGSQWSPKRNEIAYTIYENGRANLCIYDVARKQRRTLLDKAYRQIFWGFTWSPDAAWICFEGHLPDGRPEIAAVATEGEKKGFKIVLPSSASPEIDTAGCTMSWGGSGSQILISMKKKTDRAQQFYIFDFTGGRAPRLLPGFPADWESRDMVWSPDGKKVVFSAQPLAQATHTSVTMEWRPRTLVATTAAPAAGSGSKITQSQNNLKFLALAMHNYAQAHRCFPPAVLYGPDGKTPYSWRVALLPYLDQKALYDRYHFDEPWDGPNNRQLLSEMPAVFRCPTQPAGSKNASYFAVVGPETIFAGKKGTGFAQITDGTSNTILLVEAKRDIPWTKPEDIPYDANQPPPKLGGHFQGRFAVALADGSVRMLPSAIDEKVLRALLTKAGGEVTQIPQ